MGELLKFDANLKRDLDPRERLERNQRKLFGYVAEVISITARQQRLYDSTQGITRIERKPIERAESDRVERIKHGLNQINQVMNQLNKAVKRAEENKRIKEIYNLNNGVSNE